MNTELYQNIKGKFSAKWRIEPFEAAEATLTSVGEIYPELAERMSVSSGYRVLNATNLTANEASLIEQTIESFYDNVVYTCQTYAEAEKSASPAMSLPSAAKKTSRINSSDVIVTQETFDALKALLETNSSKTPTTKIHTYNLEVISRLKLECLAFAAEDVGSAGCLREQRFISINDVSDKRINDKAKSIISITTSTGSVYPVDESTIVRGPDEDKLLSSHRINNFNECPGDAPEYRKEIENLVFNRKNSHITARPFDLACDVMKEFDESGESYGASKLRGEIDVWGSLTEQIDQIIEAMRAKGVKIIEGRNCGASFKPDSQDKINPFDLSAWKTDK